MYKERYAQWCELATEDPDLKKELDEIAGDESAISDRFYKELEFGTGGLRGVIGAGTNRMNIYTVGRATQGLAEYVNSVSDRPQVAIAYDSRNKSELFAKTAACVLAANGVQVHLYPELMPTPMLSYAVRRLQCDAGIVITASHNPAKYNGYKAYGPDGCQLTLEASAYVLSIMNKVDIFGGVKKAVYDEALADGRIRLIEPWLIESYLDEVQKQSVGASDCQLQNIKVVYTPLHGSGNKPVRAILKRIGVKQVTVVPEQELPDGNFPTAPYPNPEIREAFGCALSLAERVQPDLLLATDPDCDRVGIAVRDREGAYQLVSGNEVGALLLDYLLSRRTALGTLPKCPVAVKTIVTTELCRGIANAYGCELIDVLTGFKFIGEQIGLLEAAGEENRYIFGFEESYGYLAGTYVRDKDAVVASMLICEMAGYYKAQGKNLLEVLESLFRQYGYYRNVQESFAFEGMTGMQKMNDLMQNLRKAPPKTIGESEVESIRDYEASKKTMAATGETEVLTLPKSNVLCYDLQDGSSAIVRPSGTEPKIKIYLSVVGASSAECDQKMEALRSAMQALLHL